MADGLIRWADYNLTTGLNNGLTEEDAFRGEDALNYAIANMDTYAKQCTINNHILRIVIKGVGKSNISMIMQPFDSSYLTDNEYGIQIEIEESEKHQGFFDSNKFFIYALDVSGDTLFLTQSTFHNIKFKNMQFKFGNWGAFQLWSSVDSNCHYVFENCILDNSEATRFTVCFSARGFHNQNSSITLIDCIFINWNINYPDTHGSLFFMYASTSLYVYIYNCQFNNVSKIFYDNYQTTNYTNITYINNIFYNVTKLNNSGTNTYITENVNCDRNASNNLVIPGVGTNYTNQTFTFKDPGSGKYLITYQDQGAKGKGIVNSYNTDILGNIRKEPWDIGAYCGYRVKNNKIGGLLNRERLVV